MSSEIITRPRVFAIIFGALLALTATTTAVSYVNLGWFNPVAAFMIACAKMLLVALFFMEIRHSSRITKITVGAGLFWLMILLTLTLSDYLTRWWPT